jgi:Holliday junction resolvasome RuvABC endonuclease subunit
MRILSCDGGSVNWGIAVIDVNKKYINVVKHGFVTTCVFNFSSKPLKTKTAILEPVQEQLPTFVNDVKDYIKKYKPDVVVCERFMARRGIQTKIAETISFMNAIWVTEALSKKINYHLLTASQWKRKLNQKMNIDTIYKIAKERKITNHEVDAIFMGIYISNAEPYSWITEKKIQTLLD